MLNVEIMEDQIIFTKEQIIKIVNYGKNGVYLYSAIVKINDDYFWTESKLLKDKNDKKTFDFTTLKIQKKLNEYCLEKYNLK